MAPRKGGGGGKKKGSAKKRKNVWDDYTAPAKRGGDRGADDDNDERGSSQRKKPKREPRESMFGQWKKQKQQFRTKTRAFASAVEQRRHEQREAFLALKQRHADALHASAALDPARLTKKQRKALLLQRQQESDEDETAGGVDDAGDDSDVSSDGGGDDDDDDGGDELMVTKKQKRASVFDQFLQVFQPAARAVEEDEGEDDDEEFEEVLVNEDGEEIDEDGNVVEQDDGDDDGEEDAGTDAEQDGDGRLQDAEEEEEADAEQQLDDDDAEQLELAQDHDPFRRRFLLTAFEERDALQYDALAKKFSALAPQNDEGLVVHHAPPSEYNTTYRNGSLAAECALAPLDSKLYVRSRLLEAWKAKQLDPEALWTAQSLEYSLFHQLCSYKDVFFAAQTFESTETLRRLSAMHVLNHVVKSRDTVTRNNERLRRRQAKETDASSASAEGGAASGLRDGDDEDKEYRDQGFCRATVLVLLPLRSAALAFVKLLLELLPATVDTFHNKDRFFSEYGSAKDEDDEDAGNGDGDGDRDDDGMKEWQKVFAEGNNDDCFQIGLSLTRKAMRFYSEYHHADIILASPLGLRQQLGDEVVELDDAEDGGATVRLSTDFLTSVEVCVVDSASLMLMQNVEHLRHVVRALNVQPKEAPNADFARIREWNLAFLGAYLRQTIVFAHGVEPALNHLVTKCCKNVGGTVKYTRVCDPADGSASISRVVPQVKQIFQRIDVDSGRRPLSAAQEVELRFAYFKKHVFEPLLDHPKKHVLIFFPSYFDYVRVRNLFNESMNKKLIRSVQCCEYTTNKQVSRARTSFFHGKAHVMLVTERFHFYHQYQLRGIRQLIWYGPPQMGAFYPEMLNMLGTSGGGDDSELSDMDGKSSIALFTRLDLFRMQRIVGNKRAERMCQPKAVKPTFLFC